MLNTITVMGRLTANPTLRFTQSGLPVCTFSVACQRDYKSANSDSRETDFIDITAWRKTAEFVSKYFRKGRMAIIDGRLQIRDWMDRDGNKRRSAEVIANSVNFGDSRPQDQAAQAPAYSGNNAAPAYPGTSPAPAYTGNSTAQEPGWSDTQYPDRDLPF